MKINEFWHEVKLIYDRMNHSDEKGIDLFIEDIENLFDKWSIEKAKKRMCPAKNIKIIIKKDGE